MKLTLYVDVESAFHDGVRDSVIEHLTGLDPEHCELFAWSEHGAEAARTQAIQHGIEGRFSGFLTKPHVMLDAQAPRLWPGLVVQDPAQVKRATEASYRTSAFPAHGHITILEGLEVVRKRPAMYVGPTEDTTHMMHWALRDRVGQIEDTAGARAVAVRVLPGDELELVDDWARYPATIEGLHKACSHLGLAFELAVLNALSRRFEAEVWADGVWVRAEYERGKLTRGPFESTGPLGSGTRLRFTPDSQIFESTRTDPAWLAARLEELSVLEAGVSLTLEAEGKTQRFFNREGLGDWVRARAGEKAVVRRGVVRTARERCEVAWAWTLDAEAEAQIRGWANGVHQTDGGSHVQAVQRFLSERAPTPQHRLVAAVHVNMPHPRFAAPVKDHLQSPEIEPLVRLAIDAALFEAGSPD